MKNKRILLIACLIISLVSLIGCARSTPIPTQKASVKSLQFIEFYSPF